MLLEPGEIPELNDGRANAFDFATDDGLWSSGNANSNESFAWTELDLIQDSYMRLAT